MGALVYSIICSLCVALNLPLSGIVALVQSAALFREAAGVYLYLSEEVLPSLNSVDAGKKPPEATSSVASIMSLICLAEAQVSFSFICSLLFEEYFLPMSYRVDDASGFFVY